MGEKRIIVVEGGWNFIANYSADGVVATLRNAQAIRYWGTTSGLGEIAAYGPTEKTRLDVYGTIEVPLSKVVFTIACAKW